MRESCDTLILSDLHLGSEASRAADAVQLLRTVSFNRLILLGDIFPISTSLVSRATTGSSSRRSGGSPTPAVANKSSGSKAITTSASPT